MLEAGEDAQPCHFQHHGGKGLPQTCSALALPPSRLKSLGGRGQGPKERAAGPLEAADAHLFKALAVQIGRLYVVCSTRYNVPPSTSPPTQSKRKARGACKHVMSCVQEGVKVCPVSSKSHTSCMRVLHVVVFMLLGVVKCRPA